MAITLEINDTHFGQIKKLIDEKVTDELLQQMKPRILAEVSKMVVLTIQNDAYGSKDRFIIEIKP